MESAPRALLVGADDARGLLAALRSLHRRGWTVGVATPSSRGMVARSRHAARWHPLTVDVVRSVQAAVVSGAYDVVLPGGDAELAAISEARESIGAVVPYGSKTSVRCILDKLAMTSVAARHGLQVPETQVATEEAVQAVEEETVLKPASHVEGRGDTVVSEDREELSRAARDMWGDGTQPLLQERTLGRLLALSVVLGADGAVLAAVQQRADGTWPPEAGVSVRARTVPVDEDLLGRVAAFLRSIGWVGLAELQFMESADGPHLIDVNGRCYGSLALASAAGVDLAAVWADSATGRPVEVGAAEAGVRYQWLYGDLRRGWRTGHDLVGPLLWARGAAHSVWDRDDPRPAARHAVDVLGSMVRRVRR